MNFIPVQFYLLSFFQLFCGPDIDYQKGVYVLNTVVFSHDDLRIFEFPADSIFVYKNLMMEKTISIEQ